MKRLFLYFAVVGLLTGCGADEPESELPEALQEILSEQYTPFSNGEFERPDTMRLLVIGNSFAKNAVDNYLKDMLSAAGLHFELGRLFKESASLQMHVYEGICTEEYYEFYICDSEGRSENLPNCNLEEALAANKWNCVSVQQASEFSGQYDSYTEYLPSLLNYCQYALNSPFEIFFHQTWAFDSTFESKKFLPYDNDQELMYSKIVECSRKVMADYKFDLLVPCGTAVQNGRTTDAYAFPTADGCHLRDYSGWYLAACVWYEAITGLDVRDIDFKPAGVSKEEQRIAEEAAHAAIVSPYAVTKIK